jgi:hypothetical protein
MGQMEQIDRHSSLRGWDQLTVFQYAPRDLNGEPLLARCYLLLTLVENTHHVYLHA